MAQSTGDVIPTCSPSLSLKKSEASREQQPPPHCCPLPGRARDVRDPPVADVTLHHNQPLSLAFSLHKATSRSASKTLAFLSPLCRRHSPPSPLFFSSSKTIHIHHGQSLKKRRSPWSPSNSSLSAMSRRFPWIPSSSSLPWILLSLHHPLGNTPAFRRSLVRPRRRRRHLEARQALRSCPAGVPRHPLLPGATLDLEISRSLPKVVIFFVASLRPRVHHQQVRHCWLFFGHDDLLSKLGEPRRLRPALTPLVFMQ